MVIYLKKFKFLTFVAMSIAVSVLLIFSDICKNGIERGMLICGNVIIPSLFPFTVCILIIVNIKLTLKNRFVSKILKFVFGQNFDMFCVMIFSFVGGYPIGSKLIDELYSQNKINKKTANLMQMYCVNAGPAFIITAVGKGIFNSKDLGIVLFLSHITASIIIAILLSPFAKKELNENYTEKENTKNFSALFVNAVSDASSAVMNICCYVLLFSVINSLVVYFFGNTPILKNIIFFTEVTSGITYTKNIFFISFLLGFSGISIWCQILTLSKKAKPDFKLFVFGRILHGTISLCLTYIILKLFKIEQSTVSNNSLLGRKMFYNGAMLSISLAIMIIVLLIYIFSENYSRKLSEDMI